jgi:bacterioferritin
MSATREQIIEELKVAYRMELETTLNYVANSINLDGIRAEEIKKALLADITAELNHAQQLGNRIKTLGGTCPGSLGMKFGQKHLQPPADTTDVIAVIKGVIEGEDTAVKQYDKLIRLCESVDYVTQDLCITLMGEEETHRRDFQGFLKEYTK